MEKSDYNIELTDCLLHSNLLTHFQK